MNQSQKDFAVVDTSIRFGLAAIKNVGEGAVEAVIEARKEGGPFRSFFELFRRVDLRKLNKRMMEGLIKTGPSTPWADVALNIWRCSIRQWTKA